MPASSPRCSTAAKAARRSRKPCASSRRSTTSWAASCPMRACSTPPTPPTPSGEILRRHPGEDHRHLLEAAVLRARAQPARRRRARDGDGQFRARPLPALARGSAQGEALSARRQARAAVPREGGDGARRLGPAVQRDHDGAALRGRRREAAASSRRSTACSIRTRAKRRRRRRGVGEGVQGECAAVHADHQHARQGQGDLRPLARLRRRRRLAPSRQPGRARGGRRAGRRRARGLSPHLAPLLRDEGEMARQEEARLLGPQRAAARGAEAGDRLGRRARDGADRLRRFLAAHGRHRRRVLRQGLDRCAGAGRQVAGRLLPPDGAERAPLYPAQLPGQAARRDDARARARPRRAPGARQCARAADGADAADAGRDRVRVRRDADLPRAARAGADARASARRCSPPRSRT